MTRLSVEAKEAIVQQALSRSDTPLSEIAAKNNVGYSTLQKWLRLRRDGNSLGCKKPAVSSINKNIHPLDHLLATAGLDAEKIGRYCRGQGIYSYQLKEWREELMAKNNGGPSEKQRADNNKLKLLRDENKQLKKELRYKDKALAETSALLVLKKKRT